MNATSLLLPNTFVTEDWPHGLRCVDCSEEFLESETIYHRAVDEDVYEIVCAGCVGLAS